MKSCGHSFQWITDGLDYGETGRLLRLICIVFMVISKGVLRWSSPQPVTLINDAKDTAVLHKLLNKLTSLQY